MRLMNECDQKTSLQKLQTKELQVLMSDGTAAKAKAKQKQSKGKAKAKSKAKRVKCGNCLRSHMRELPYRSHMADCTLFCILHPLDGLRMLADRHMPMFSIFFCSSQQTNLINLQPLTVLRDLTSFDHLQEMTRGCADYNEICLMQGLFMTSENARTLGADRQNHSCKDFRR